MSSASDQKLLSEMCSVFNCSFDEFVGEKVVSPSYFSAILAPPPGFMVYFKLYFLSYSTRTSCIPVNLLALSLYKFNDGISSKILGITELKCM